MSAFWACARLQPGREALALHFLEARGFSPYYPCLREWARRFGRKIELRPPLFHRHPTAVACGQVVAWRRAPAHGWTAAGALSRACH
jgi:hypothetical protein